MWYDFPSVGGHSPELPLTIRGAAVRSVRHHSSRIRRSAESPNWVASSCVVGVEEIDYRISRGASDSNRFTVRLHFSELEGFNQGKRTFNVSLQDQSRLVAFDVVREAGAKFLPIVKEFKGIEIDETLKLQFEKLNGLPCLAGLEVIPEY
jgi:hypothetical protein